MLLVDRGSFFQAGSISALDSTIIGPSIALYSESRHKVVLGCGWSQEGMKELAAVLSLLLVRDNASFSLSNSDISAKLEKLFFEPCCAGAVDIAHKPPRSL